jgi:hypothetical protein
MTGKTLVFDGEGTANTAGARVTFDKPRGANASYYVVDEMKNMSPDEALRMNVAEVVSGARRPWWEKLGLGIPRSSGDPVSRVHMYAVGDYTMAYVRNDRQKPVQRWCEVRQHMTGDRVCIHTYQDWKDWQTYAYANKLQLQAAMKRWRHEIETTGESYSIHSFGP